MRQSGAAGGAALNDVLRRAERAAGLEDWGGERAFEDGLARLLQDQALLAEPQRGLLHARIVELLVHRLRLVADAAAHPDILAEPIDPPLFLIGMPRTGTTYAHQLFALDPAARVVRAWEAAEPSPPPCRTTYAADPRVAAAQAAADAFLAATPDMALMHDTGAHVPAECGQMLNPSFIAYDLTASFNLPTYHRWLAGGPTAGLFELHRRLLRQFQWRGPRGRWTLKNPPYLFCLPALLDAYPGSPVIQTHRDPARTLVSLCSLIFTMRRAVDPAADRRAIAAEVVEMWAEALDRSTRQRREAAVDDRILDVAYADLAADPVGTVERCHDRFGLPFSGAHADAIRAHVAAQPSGAGQGHRFDPADFGLDTAALRQRFGEYRDRFGHLI